MDHRPGQTRREAGTQSQGSSSEDRPVAGVQHKYSTIEVSPVKAILARFTLAVSLLRRWPLPSARGQVGLVGLSVITSQPPLPNRSIATRPDAPVTAGTEPSWTVRGPVAQKERPIRAALSLPRLGHRTFGLGRPRTTAGHWRPQRADRTRSRWQLPPREQLPGSIERTGPDDRRASSHHPG
jgi:hypothetical protein